MFKRMKAVIVLALAVELMMGLLTGCGSKTLKLEPFDKPWGTSQEEAGAALKCVYRTNEREPGKIYVMNGDNDNALEAFGTTPSVIIYDFNLVKGEDPTLLLGKMIVLFPEEDYDSVLAYMNKKCGEQGFNDPQWGVENTDVYLFSGGVLYIQYNASPLVDPADVAEENRDRYIGTSGLLRGSISRMATLEKENFYMLWMFSTAETDFVTVDNSK